MPSYYCLSIRFLDGVFHGRRDGGLPEWPPSPIRVFQSLTAAAAALWRAGLPASRARSALMWLEQQPAPILIAPIAAPVRDKSSGYCLSVQNNTMDIVAKAWCRGNYSNTGDANPDTHRRIKTVRPIYMVGGDCVHYLWPLSAPLSGDVRGHLETINEVARSVFALGWGIDMVVGQGSITSDEQLDALPGEQWLPVSGNANEGLRVPVRGTLEDLIHRHERFLNRIGPEGFTAPPPLSVYRLVDYRRASDPLLRPVAAFSLLKPDTTGFRAFDTPRQALTVSGMMRYATRVAAELAGWAEPAINESVLGHGEPKSAAEHQSVGPKRFAFLPLPSIESRGQGQARVVGSVRRIIITSFVNDFSEEIAWARRALSGQELIQEDNKQPVAVLSLIPSSDPVVRNYLRPAASWSTVTPVVLPGYDDPAHYRRRLRRGTSVEEQNRLLDRLSERIDGLLRKAIVQAGFSQVLADHAEIAWRKVGFWPGADLADRYGAPDHLRRFPRYHARITWHDIDGKPVQVPGPFCIGGGRFYGLGLFAGLTDG